MAVLGTHSTHRLGSARKSSLYAETFATCLFLRTERMLTPLRAFPLRVCQNQAPFDANCIGEYDILGDTFSCHDYTSAVDSMTLGAIGSSGKFEGVAPSVERKIVFAPYGASCVGVYRFPETMPMALDSHFSSTTHTFACIDISHVTTSSAKFSGAAALMNGKVAFAPSSATCLGLFDAYDYSMECIPHSPTPFDGSQQMMFSGIWSTARYGDPAAPVAVLAPMNADVLPFAEFPPPPAAPPLGMEWGNHSLNVVGRLIARASDGSTFSIQLDERSWTEPSCSWQNPCAESNGPNVLDATFETITSVANGTLLQLSNNRIITFPDLSLPLDNLPSTTHGLHINCGDWHAGDGPGPRVQYLASVHPIEDQWWINADNSISPVIRGVPETDYVLAWGTWRSASCDTPSQSPTLTLEYASDPATTTMYFVPIGPAPPAPPPEPSPPPPVQVDCTAPSVVDGDLGFAGNIQAFLAQNQMPIADETCVNVVPAMVAFYNANAGVTDSSYDPNQPATEAIACGSWEPQSIANDPLPFSWPNPPPGMLNEICQQFCVSHQWILNSNTSPSS